MIRLEFYKVNVTFIKDEEIVKEKQLDQESIKLYMQEHLDEKELEHARKLVKLFKCNKLTFDLKE